MTDKNNHAAEPLEAEVISDSGALATILKSEIDMQITTAKQYPRSMTEFMRKALSMATINEDIADSCAYALPRGGKTLEGPSVRLAEIVCAAYTNIRAGARVIMNDGKNVTAQGFCHDLENNNFIAVEVKRSILQHEKIWNPVTKKMEPTGKMVTMNDDMQTVTGNAACAIAYRNAVFKIIPAALIEDVFQKVKEVAKGTAETLVARRNKAVAYFHGLGVKDEQICAVLNIKNIDDIDLDKLAVLTGMRSAIKNQEATVEDLFNPKEKDPTKKGSDATNQTVDAIKKAQDEKKK